MIELLEGDCREILPTLRARSVHAVVTSPPYFQLRDYEEGDQIGLEDTPTAYVQALVGVFREVKRVLRNDGILWLNLGDCYAANAGGSAGDTVGQDGYVRRKRRSSKRARKPMGLKPKDLFGIPWMLAFALRDDGWYLRQDVIWHKPNARPESIVDRCTKAHEYVFMLTKRELYYFDADAIAEEATQRRSGNKKRVMPAARNGIKGRGNLGSSVPWQGRTRNKRSVWTIPTEPYLGEHSATFPSALAETCILASTSAYGCCGKCGAPWRRIIEREDTGWDGSKYGERAVGVAVGTGGFEKSTLGSSGGTKTGQRRTVGWEPSCKCGHTAAVVPATVLDPFMGAGTTGLVAARLQREAIGIELSADYVAQARARIAAEAPPMFPVLAAETV